MPPSPYYLQGPGKLDPMPWTMAVETKVIKVGTEKGPVEGP